MITEREYREAIDNLGDVTLNLSDEEKIKKIDSLAEDLKEMILGNPDSMVGLGTVYYVAQDGSDENDGKSEDTAWATLGKVNGADLKSGDAVLFKRGNFWYGQLILKDDVIYSAYGSGEKPQIIGAYKADKKWEKTETENLWVYPEEFHCSDIGIVLFDGGKAYGEMKKDINDCKTNLDYAFEGENLKVTKKDNRVYVYYDKDINADFSLIEFSISMSVTAIGGRKNVIVHNLELKLGQDYCFGGNTENVRFSYCILSWSGGQRIPNENIRFGGGGGCWYNCDGFYYDHCYIYQQFDAGVTPQYDCNDKAPALFRDFKVSDCLFEKIEYTLEFFMTQRSDARYKAKFENLYFGYNLCREGGRGFGDKTSASAYVKSWQSHDNFSKNCVIEKNVFDRAVARTLDMSARNFEGEQTFENFPAFKNNIYVQEEGKEFAMLNKVEYNYTKTDFEKIAQLGFETDPVYIFSK